MVTVTVYDKWSHMVTVEISYKKNQWSNMISEMSVRRTLITGSSLQVVSHGH